MNRIFLPLWGFLLLGCQAPLVTAIDGQSPILQPPAWQPPADETLWRVVPKSVHDGDTLRVERLGERLKIRFCGIDAPELKQAGGVASRDYLRSLLNQSGNQVMIRAIETDRYGRTVAELYRVADGQLRVVNAEMAQSGQAYYYAHYAANCPNHGLIARAEQAARQQRLGVWAKPGAVPPWEWRRAKR